MKEKQAYFGAGLRIPVTDLSGFPWTQGHLKTLFRSEDGAVVIDTDQVLDADQETVLKNDVQGTISNVSIEDMKEWKARMTGRLDEHFDLGDCSVMFWLHAMIDDELETLYPRYDDDRWYLTDEISFGAEELDIIADPDPD